MKRIACLHAHHSNIPLLDEAVAPWNAELVHYVDPGSLLQHTGVCSPTTEQSHDRLISQLLWMEAANPDAIVITCTQYAAALKAEDEARLRTPVFTIDGPFLADIAEREGPQTLLFANPATVTPTMQRLQAYAAANGLRPQIEVQQLTGAFALLMENKQEAYLEAVRRALDELLSATGQASLSVAQLSMVPVARRFTAETGRAIGHPLQSLTTRLVQTLHLEWAESSNRS